MPEITVHNLTASFQGRHSSEVLALNEMNVTFRSDSFNVVVGYSGCGKTTLLKCIAGLKEYDGTILFDGADVTELSPFRKTAYAF